MIKRKIFSICFLFLLVASLSSVSHATIPPAPYTSAELQGHNWFATSNTIDLNEGFFGLACKLRASNDKNSLEKMTYSVYYKENWDDEYRTIKSGTLAPGESIDEWLSKVRRGTYYVAIGCDDSEEVLYLFPPCKGKASLNRF